MQLTEAVAHGRLSGPSSDERARGLILEILRRWNLTSPNPDWPLFRYRVSDQEYLRGFEIILEAAKHGYPGEAIRRNAGEPCKGAHGPWLDMVFVLFVAEWWRRNYVDGPVTYKLFLGELRISDDAGERQNLYAPIERGLREWGRAVVQLNDRNRYLATLAGEGGIPIKLLRKSQSRLTSFFCAVLRDARDFRCRGEAILGLALSRSEMLPASQRQEAVFVATKLLVGAVIDLIPVLQHWDGKDLFSHLDKGDPDWRARLPIDVSDEEAKTLFETLVEKARTAPAPVASRPLHGQVILRKQESGWSLIRNFFPPRSLSASSLASSLHKSVDAISSRQVFDLFLQAGSGSLVGLARVSRIRDGRDGARFLLEPEQRSARALEGDDCSAPVFLVAFEEGLEFAREVIPGLTLNNAAPWIFEGEGESEFRLLAQSTCLVTAAEVLILPPPGSTVEAGTDGTATPAPEFSGLPRAAWRVQGPAQVTLPEGKRYSVRTRQRVDDYFVAGLSGKTKLIGEGRAACFVGPPEVRLHSLTGPSSQVPQAQLQWRPRVGGAAWRVLDEKCAGDVDIRYEHEGDIILDDRAAVLPADFTFRVVPSARVGSLEISGLHFQPEFVDLPETVSRTWTNPSPGRWVAELQPKGQVPSAATLATRWKGGSRLNLQLPFPYRGARFIDRSGRQIPSESRVHVDLLAGIRAEVLSPEHGSAFQVHAELVSGGSQIEGEALSIDLPLPETEKGQGRFEVDLGVLAGQIQFLFCATDNLDATVNLSVATVRGLNIPVQRLTVARYANSLQFNLDAALVTISTDSPVTLAGASEISVRARNLLSPETEALTLELDDHGAYTFDIAQRGDGPWLITGERNGWHEARPKLWIENYLRGLPAGLGPLGSALVLTTRAERMTALKGLFQQLSANAAHPEWTRVFSFFVAFRDLPPASLDLFAALPSSRELLAALALHASGEAELLQEFLGFIEKLPFAWFLMPPRTWARALAGYRSALEKSLPQDLAAAIYQRAVKTLAEQGAARICAFETSFGAAQALAIEPLVWPNYIVDCGKPAGPGKYFKECKALEDAIRSGDRTFPDWRGLKPLYERMASETPRIRKEFPWRECSREIVVNAPRVAALCVATGAPLVGLEAVHFRRIRSFSESGFDSLFELHLPQAIFALDRPLGGLRG